MERDRRGKEVTKENDSKEGKERKIKEKTDRQCWVKWRMEEAA